MSPVFRFTGLFMPPKGFGPGPPPTTVRMSWTTQPTDTAAGGAFDPWVVVQVSDGQEGDVISVSNTCGGPTGESVTNASGYAVFPGLGAGDTAGEGCRLIAHNLTRPQIPSVISEPFNVGVLAPVWELIASTTGYYNAGYAVIYMDTSGSTLIVLAWGTVDPVRLGYFTDNFGNTGWQMATVANLTMMWLFNPTNTGPGHGFVLQDNNNATGSGMAFFGNNPQLISSTSFNILSTSSIAAPAVAITNDRQLVVSGLGTGNVTPSNISGPLVDYVAVIQPPTVAFDGSGVPLHGSGIGQKLPVSGTEEQPVWIGLPAGPMSTRTLVFEALSQNDRSLLWNGGAGKPFEEFQ